PALHAPGRLPPRPLCVCRRGDRRRVRQAALLEGELEEARAGDRVRPVRRDLDEADVLVERLSRLHPRNRVQAYAPVAAIPRSGDGCLRELSPEPEPPVSGPDEETLHLACIATERAKGDAARGTAVDAGDDQRAGRRCVVAWELGELAVEVLE